MTVIRLKGGDPFVFGRGVRRSESVRDAGVRFEIVPGVSSAIAAPANVGIPLTPVLCIQRRNRYRARSWSKQGRREMGRNSGAVWTL
jgi:siroheme synthase